jgi:UDP-4-amino-4,6-dideoxy-N-acetyl-beta-L-altrosamine transaminase
VTLLIPYGHQSISPEDIRAVVEVLGSEWLTQGPAIARFEELVADACEVAHAVAVSSGTAALHAAAWASGLGPRGLLWTSPITYVATANCARFVGADVDFVDIDPATLNMDVSALGERLEVAERMGRLPDVVAPVHMCGASCNMDAIHGLAQRYGFTVIEDAAHALGGSYLGHPVGSCVYSEMATLSFHPVKIVTTGEGGMVLTNSGDFAARLRLFRSHGVTRDPAMMESPLDGAWYYEMIELGHNLRMSDIQAALGAAQMTRLGEFVARRNELVRRYDIALDGLPVARQSVPPGTQSAYHLYVIRVEAGDRAEIFRRLLAAGIGVNVHYIPVHLQPYYRRLGFGPGDFPEAEQYYREAVTLPLFPAMTDEEQDVVVAALTREMERA